MVWKLLAMWEVTLGKLEYVFARVFAKTTKRKSEQWAEHVKGE